MIASRSIASSIAAAKEGREQVYWDLVVYTADYQPFGEVRASSGAAEPGLSMRGQVAITGSEARVWQGAQIVTLRSRLFLDGARGYDPRVGAHLDAAPAVWGGDQTRHPYASLPVAAVPLADCPHGELLRKRWFTDEELMCLNAAWEYAHSTMMPSVHLRDVCDSSWDENWNSAFMGRAFYLAMEAGSLCAGLSGFDVAEASIATGSYVLVDCPGFGTITVADLGRNRPPRQVTVRTCAKFGDLGVKDYLLRKYTRHPGRRWGPYQWWFFP